MKTYSLEGSLKVFITGSIACFEPVANRVANEKTFGTSCCGIAIAATTSYKVFNLQFYCEKFY